MQNIFKGKALYNPKGKAGEYAKWACNFYVGCTNGCLYCYCKKGILKGVMGQDNPQLKSCFKDEENALEVFKKEVEKNKYELQKHGLFFSFTTDPMIKETVWLTISAVHYCNEFDIPVSILTKHTGYAYLLGYTCDFKLNRKLISIGCTLSGHDELEPNACSNAQRIELIRICKEYGYLTFASIEPIIDFKSSKRMIEKSIEYCDLYKIGLMAGKKYDVQEAQLFVEWLNSLNKSKIYLKENIQKLTGYKNSDLDEYFVDSDYNQFK